jgi:hypothetical protein
LVLPVGSTEYPACDAWRGPAWRPVHDHVQITSHRSHKPGAFTEAGGLTGWLLASHAAVAFSSARTQAQLERSSPLFG